MIIDLKYHIASLVAVFLALAIGILIGTTMVNSGLILEQQKQIIDRLEGDFNELRQVNQALERDIKVLSDENERNLVFQKEVIPALIENKIPDMKIAIIKTNPDISHQELQEMIEEAGGMVTSVTTFHKNYTGVIRNEKQELKSLNLPSINWEKDDSIIREITNQLVIGLITGENEEVRNYLIEREIIEINGQYGVEMDAVVLIGGCSNEVFNYFKFIDSPAIDMLKKWGIRVIGSESTDVTISYITEYQKKGLSTVDNIDTDIGRMSSIYLLAGQKGDYGIKDTADRLLPGNI